MMGIYVLEVIVGALVALGSIGLLVLYDTKREWTAGGLIGSRLLSWLLIPVGASIMAHGLRKISSVGHATARTRWKTADDNVRVYQAMDLQSDVIATVKEGSDIEFVNDGSANRAGWVGVALTDGRRGYVPDTTGVHKVKCAAITKEASTYTSYLFSQPSSTLSVGSEVEIAVADLGLSVDLW